MKLLFDIFEKHLNEKTRFRKKVHVRKPYESSIRTLAGEGSPEKQKSKKIDKSIKKNIQE